MNNINDLAVFNAMLRADFFSYTQRSFVELNQGTRFDENWHLEYICYHLELAAKKKIKRLIITLPPRHLKSHCASVALPSWILGNDPTARIITASYSDDLAKTFSRQARQLIGSPWHQRAFPKLNISRRKDAVGEYHTTKGGYRVATSVGGTLTGKGGDMIIMDDPQKPDEAQSDVGRASVNGWYDNTLYSRLDNKHEGTIILIMQRLHEDDLVGHILELDDWVHINIPAIASGRTIYDLGSGKQYIRQPEEVLHEKRESRKELDKIKKQLGSYNFEAQYQQNPIPLEGNFYKRDWINYYDKHDLPDQFDRVVQSWDTASKDGTFNDYSVCTTWGITHNSIYLLNVHRGKYEYPELKKAVISQWRKYRPETVLIEDASSGTHLISDLRATGPFRAVPRKPTGNKKDRAFAQTGKLESGEVKIPVEAPWLDEFLKELLAFPGGRHDDQVDSVTQFLLWSNHYRHRLDRTKIGKRQRKHRPRRPRRER